MTIPRKPLAIMKKAEHTISALRLTHAELSGVTSLDFMVEHLDHSPLNDAARESLRPQVKQIIEETTTRGFRVKLLL